MVIHRPWLPTLDFFARTMGLPPTTLACMLLTHRFDFQASRCRIPTVFVCVWGRTLNSLHWLCSCRSRCGSRTAGPSRRRTPPRIQTNGPPPPTNRWPPATSCASWSKGDSCLVPPRHQTPCWGRHRTRPTMAPCWAAPAEPPPPPRASAAAPHPPPCQEGLSGCLCRPWAEPHLRRGSASHRRTPSAFPCRC